MLISLKLKTEHTRCEVRFYYQKCSFFTNILLTMEQLRHYYNGNFEIINI